VRCDPVVAGRREAARGDRVPGMAAKQADVVHQGVAYDLEVDTTRTASPDCALTIAAHLRSSRGDRAD
uniref:phosphotransferase-like protein n=1 Tax=Promicromonospora kroppenstedtii TaxID=440482 RepID=UPI00055E2D73